MTTREKLKLMDEIRRKNDAAFAEAARRQRESKSRMLKAMKEVMREFMMLVSPAVIGVMVGILVVLNAQ